MSILRLPAEWETQDLIQIAFPSRQSDWIDYWNEIIPCYINIIKVIACYQPLLIVCDNESELKKHICDIDDANIYIIEIPINDTWARDHGAITVQHGNEFIIYDFMFNGWGLKFGADKDNLITKELWKKGVYSSKKLVTADLVLEGGSIESDGKGTVLTTSNCLLSPNRNPHLSKEEIEQKLKTYLGLKQMLWLDYGHLEGDDTDAHIDTLARLCDQNTIAYVQCTDVDEAHYKPLKEMEVELQALKTTDGKPYNLVSLPMCDAVYAPDDDRRLPATYANFLIMNDVVLMPTYNLPQDAEALAQLQKAFPGKKIEGVDCRALLLQHGSLHCITMQYPKGSINFEALEQYKY
ncbi:MAG: agmatine deiminase family protein [Chitinophagales bacterium]